jgi:hypothetical protein
VKVARALGLQESGAPSFPRCKCESSGASVAASLDASVVGFPPSSGSVPTTVLEVAHATPRETATTNGVIASVIQNTPLLGGL